MLSCQKLWQLSHLVGRSLPIECQPNFCYRGLFLIVNRVKVNIDPRQGGCLGLCTLVYETVILVLLGRTLEARSTTQYDDK